MPGSSLSPPPSKAIRSQQRANRSTRDHWSYFASHRAEIQNLVLSNLDAAGAGAARKLCVLGAGNCNDIDLAVLSRAFAEVHLVDIDAHAIESAAARQDVARLPAIHLQGGVDLTGIAELFVHWERSPPTSEEVRSAAERALVSTVPRIGGPFDVVLSPCLLSQLVGYADDVLGRSHPRRRELLLALRTRHLRTVVDLLAPGGAAVIVCDVASSDGHPQLATARRDRLPDLLDRLTYTDRGFEGLSPQSMRSAVQSDPLIAPLLGAVQTVAPWLWRLGPKRTFLVYALRLRRLPGPVLLNPAGVLEHPTVVPQGPVVESVESNRVAGNSSCWSEKRLAGAAGAAGGNRLNSRDRTARRSGAEIRPSPLVSAKTL